MLNDHWYVAISSIRLKRKPQSVELLGQKLVAFRDGASRAHILLDRCPHRGVALSRGRLAEGKLECPYHGWRFDGTGACTQIPSLRSDQHIPSGIGIPAFRSVEQDGYLWVWMGEGEPHPARPMPIEEFSRYRWVQGRVTMECEGMKGIENNVDPCHAGYAHRWTHPQFFTRFRYGERNTRFEMRLTETGLFAFAPPVAHADDPVPEEPVVSVRFDLPDRVCVKIGMGYRAVILMHFVPLSDNRCRFEYMFRTPLPGPKIRWSRREPIIFMQDRRLVESSQPWYDETGGDFERSVEADYTMLTARKIVELARLGQWQEKRESLQQRRVVSFRA